jgi:hypothetical protein
VSGHRARLPWTVGPACALVIVCATALALAACGQETGSGGSRSPDAAAALPPGVMTAAQACRVVVGREPRGFFTRVEQVHLVLTTYARGEPVESRGDISSGMPPGTLVWVVEVHAKAINWDHSVPAPLPGTTATSAAPPSTDFSVVMNARTGWASDAGECDCWPLPLGRVGTLVSLPAGC